MDKIMIKIKSNKRTYEFYHFNDKKIYDEMSKCESMTQQELQDYIDYHFSEANRLGSKMSSGAHHHGKRHQEKAKIAVLVMDLRR